MAVVTKLTLTAITKHNYERVWFVGLFVCFFNLYISKKQKSKAEQEAHCVKLLCYDEPEGPDIRISDMLRCATFGQPQKLLVGK